MRRDMSKVLVERQRIGSKAKNDSKGDLKKWQRGVDNNELFPKRQSTARRRRKDYKELNEHLGPLRRFLNTNIGRPWDKVYSEIRANVNPNSAVQMHILQHLDWYVTKDVVEVAKGKFTDSKGKPVVDPFFVHPRTGILHRTHSSFWYSHRRQTWARKPKYITIDGFNFRQINDIWYSVTLVPLPNPPDPSSRDDWRRNNLLVEPLCYDAVLHCHVHYNEALREHGSYVYASAKRQLNSREIKKYGLRDQESQAA